MRKQLIMAGLVLTTLTGCSPKHAEAPSLERVGWGTETGRQVYLFVMAVPGGFEARISNYGAIISAIAVPDKNGKVENVVLGFDSLTAYQLGHPYFGSMVGRYGNRIANGRFTLDGVEYNLARNNGANHLHGGLKGFDKQVFEVDTAFVAGDSVVLGLFYLSKHMEEGYPGNLKVWVTYVLNSQHELKIWYRAETDRPTVVNLTNHSYFNLTACKENVLGHRLVIFSDSITPTDSTLIPTGELHSVAGTPFDFTSAQPIGERISQVPGGYDVNYKLRNNCGQLIKAAEAYDPESGRLLEAFTTQPGIQFYTGNFLDGTLTGFSGIRYHKHSGFCLETQHFPDSPNKPMFPDVVLRPGEEYRHLTVYRFSAMTPRAK